MVIEVFWVLVFGEVKHSESIAGTKKKGKTNVKIVFAKETSNSGAILDYLYDHFLRKYHFLFPLFLSGYCIFCSVLLSLLFTRSRALTEEVIPERCYYDVEL